MKREELEEAIDRCDDRFIEEAAENREKRRRLGARRILYGAAGRLSRIRVAAASLALCLVLGGAVSAAAAVSPTFREWIRDTFGNNQVTEVKKETLPETESASGTSSETGSGENTTLALEEGMSITGDTESFVYESHWPEDADNEVVDHVYAIVGYYLTELSRETFTGDYDGDSFSFEYSVIGDEIFSYNYIGCTEEVFGHIRDGAVTVQLWKVNDDTVEQACLARCTLETGETKKISGDDKICNAKESPEGSRLLLNYRSDAYWTVFDVTTGEEKKVPGISGYAHTDEIFFEDEAHILVYGEDYLAEDGETTMTSTQRIDLDTQKVTDVYQATGEINMSWTFEQKGGELHLSNVVNGEEFAIDTPGIEYMYVTQSSGDYVLFCGDDKKYWLCSLRTKKSMEIDVPAEMRGDLTISLAKKEKRMLITDGSEVYLVSLDRLES